MKQFIVFVKKEFRHIARDKRTMLILLAMPVVMIILFGFAVTTEVKDTRVVVLDHAKDAASEQLCRRLGANSYFTLVASVSDEKAIDHLFKANEADMAIVIGPDFGAGIATGRGSSVQVLVDGSEPNQASTRAGYAQSVLADCLTSLAGAGAGAKSALQISVVTHMLYNPQGRSEYNFVPAVIGLILMLICAMMTSIAIVREKEMGTMEVLLASPLPPIVIVLAKLVPYFVISCLNLGSILILSATLLNITVAGSFVGFIAISLLYILTALLLGLFISTVANSQLAAMLLSLLLILPSVYLSGLAFPLESIPAALQRVSVIVPARWFISAARKLMIQGVDMHYVAQEAAVLGVMALTLLGVSWKMFKTRL